MTPLTLQIINREFLRIFTMEINANKYYPPFAWFTPRESGILLHQTGCAIWITDTFLDQSLEDFATNFALPLAYTMQKIYPLGKSIEPPMEIPRGVDGACKDNFRGIESRLILNKAGTYLTEIQPPLEWCVLEEYYDIEKDRFVNAAVCKCLRFDFRRIGLEPTL